MLKASFTHVIRYEISAKCVSPLRTGNSDGDVDRILLSDDGVPMIQAASLAGAMNAWRPDPTLFGGKPDDGWAESALRFTDGLFNQGTATVTMPRVQIDGSTGCAEDKKKYDVMAVCTGSEFSFEIIWFGSLPALDDSEKEKALKRIADQIEDYLSAIQAGEIRFGAQKSNGFGVVELSAERRFYNMFCREDRNAWFAKTMGGGSPVTIVPRHVNNVSFTVEAAIDAVLVRSAAPQGTGKGKIDAVNLTENGKPIIPGSSIKGALRNHLQRIAPYLKLENEIPNLLGREGSDEDSDDNGIAGKLLFSFASVNESKSQKTARIHINRITGGVIRHALFAEQPVFGTWRWEIQVPSNHPEGCLLVAYALRDLGLGLWQLGGSKAIGRGAVQEITVTISHTTTTASIHVADFSTTTVTDEKGMISKWEKDTWGVRQNEA